MLGMLPRRGIFLHLFATICFLKRIYCQRQEYWRTLVDVRCDNFSSGLQSP